MRASPAATASASLRARRALRRRSTSARRPGGRRGRPAGPNRRSALPAVPSRPPQPGHRAAPGATPDRLAREPRRYAVTHRCPLAGAGLASGKGAAQEVVGVERVEPRSGARVDACRRLPRGCQEPVARCVRGVWQEETWVGAGLRTGGGDDDARRRRPDQHSQLVHRARRDPAAHGGISQDLGAGDDQADDDETNGRDDEDEDRVVGRRIAGSSSRATNLRARYSSGCDATTSRGSASR